LQKIVRVFGPQEVPAIVNSAAPSPHRKTPAINRRLAMQMSISIRIASLPKESIKCVMQVFVFCLTLGGEVIGQNTG